MLPEPTPPISLAGTEAESRTGVTSLTGDGRGGMTGVAVIEGGSGTDEVNVEVGGSYSNSTRYSQVFSSCHQSSGILIDGKAFVSIPASRQR